MIKTQIYIRKIPEEQLRQLEQIAAEANLKTGTDVFFHLLARHLEHESEIARLKRLLEYKQNKINRLTTPQNE